MRRIGTEGGARRPTGSTVLVALQGSEIDAEVIGLACYLARQRGAELRGLYVIEVVRSLELGRWHEESEEEARSALAAAQDMAQRLGCRLHTTIQPARDAGQAIVDESVERAAEVVVLASPFRSARGDAAHHVLEKALCTVVLFRPPKGA